MSNGDSPDSFVFPPFIPTASTRPPQPPPAPPAQEPAAPGSAPDAEAGGRTTMPWDTPIVRQADEPAAASQAGADDEDDLPWLEVPAPRDADAPAPEAPPAPAGDDAFPDWLAWDQRDETAAEADARDSVAPIAGLEDFVPLDGLGGSIAPAPALEWAQPEPAAPDAAASAFDAEFPSVEPQSEPEPFTEGGFDAPPAEGADEWSLAAPEAAEPPSLDQAPLPDFAESPAAAEPSFELSVEDGILTIEPAEPAASADAAPAPFVADAEAVIAAEPAPSAADAGVDVDPEPIPAASTDATDSPFDDVAARLEGIARMLRERPDELLAGGSPDPLALLVTGYVMGYTARGGR